MAQTTVRQVVIGALIMTALLSGAFMMIGQSLPDNPGNYSDYNRTYNKFNSIKNNADAINTQTETAKPDEGPEGILSGLYSSSFGALQNVWTSIDTLKTVISDTSNGGLGIAIPNWFTALLAIIITTTIAFAMISSWRKWYT